VLIILGIITLTFAVLSGEVEIGIVIIFPFLLGSGLTAFLGFIFIFFAIIFLIFGFIRVAIGEEYDIEEHQKKMSIKGRSVVLIGPIPIIFGFNWKITLAMVILASILIIIMVLGYRFL
jgi:uncharacterized protein (TIGR00304 family)